MSTMSPLHISSIIRKRTVHTQYWHPVVTIFYHGDLDGLVRAFFGKLFMRASIRRVASPFALLF